MEILQTTDYSLFEPIVGNRTLSRVKIDKIVADVQGGFNMLPYVPCIVVPHGDKMGVVDGQHRREVSRLTNNPVYYVVCHDITLKQIAQLNSRGEKWKAVDFLNCYIALGAADYLKLKPVMSEYGISISVAVALLMFNKPQERSLDLFQDGEFKCNYEAEAIELLNLCKSLFHRYVFSVDRNLIAAVQAIHKKGKCDFDRLRDKISAAPMVMDKQKDMKNYIYNIEKVYNYGKQNRDVIY